MTKFWKISNVIVLGLLILICGLGTFYKHISFGLGLGDMFGYLVLYLVTLIHLILTLISRKKGSLLHTLLTLIFLTFTILIVLNATIWRGQEYRWNGSIFYLPCPTEITIENQEIEKEKLITMCTMDYYSEFSGNWNGQFVTIKAGDIKVPEELEEFIQRPITKVEIEPDFHEIFEDNGTRKEFDFNKDTLQTDIDYEFAGEIRAIRNEIPVIEARIK
jgi:c-di-AMP phosphodiesterase-like protein